MNNLITGVTSGLGKYLYEELGGAGLTRTNWEEVSKGSYDVIIHCAFDYKNTLDNLFLLGDLFKIPHKLFIYISSIEVYPQDEKIHFEEEVIDIRSSGSAYATVKKWEKH